MPLVPEPVVVTSVSTAFSATIRAQMPATGTETFSFSRQLRAILRSQKSEGQLPTGRNAELGVDVREVVFNRLDADR
jgi:hypothetical protein